MKREILFSGLLAGVYTSYIPVIERFLSTDRLGLLDALTAGKLFGCDAVSQNCEIAVHRKSTRQNLVADLALLFMV